jgi:hypothetical protein
MKHEISGGRPNKRSHRYNISYRNRCAGTSVSKEAKAKRNKKKVKVIKRPKALGGTNIGETETPVEVEA